MCKTFTRNTGNNNTWQGTGKQIFPAYENQRTAVNKQQSHT